MAKINENCPSYDCGECATYPAPYSVKCADVKCRWQNIEEFNKEKRQISSIRGVKYDNED